MRSTGRSLAKSTIIAILTAVAALVIGVMSSLTTVVTASIGLTAIRAIIVPGTGTPDPYAPDRQNYLNNAMNYYVNPGGDCGATTPADCPPLHRRQVLRHVLADSVARLGRTRRPEVERVGGAGRRASGRCL